MLDPAERGRLHRLLALMVVVALAETAGVVSIMPFLALVANPAVVEKQALLAALFHRLGFSDTSSFLFFSGALTIAILAASNSVAAFSAWYMHRTVYLQEHLLSRRLLEQYVAKDYEFFHAHNTAELIKNTLSEVNSVVLGVLLPLLQCAAKSMVVVLLITLLIAADPLLALILVTIMGGAYALLFTRSHTMLKRLGGGRAEANSARFKAASQLLGGIKEIKLYQRSGYFLQAYSTASERLARAWAATQIISQLPRYALEVLAFGGIIAIVLYLLATRGELDQALPLVGLYALAGYRLMPAFQQIFSALTSLRFHDAALGVLLRDLGDAGGNTATPSAQPLRLEKSIEIRGLTYRYAASREPAVSSIDFAITARSSIALVGATGSGKSTLVDLVLGLLQLQEGQILVDGTAIDAGLLPRWQRNFGYVPQQIYLTDDTIARNIAFGMADGEIDMERVRQVAKAARLDEFVQRELPAGYLTEVGERGVRLSGGERQRIGIARALYHDPDILVFDEATAALDGITEAAVIQAINDLSGRKTLIIVAHRLTTVKRCDRIFLLEGGKIAASGSYDQLFQTNDKFRAMAQNTVPESPAE